MNQLKNRVQLIGNLGREVEFKKLDNGNAVAKMSLATREVFKSKDGLKEVELQWHQLVAWGKTAEIVQTLFKKGKEVAVQGRLIHRQYTDKNGLVRRRSEIVVKEFLLLN